MKKGTRMKEEHSSNKIKIFILFVIIVAIICAVIYVFINKKEQENVGYQDNGKGPTISYYNEKDIRTNVENGQVFTKYIKIVYDKGTAYIKKENTKDSKFEAYDGAELNDGTYTIRVDDEQAKVSSKRTFTIDTIPPTIKGIKNGGEYNSAKIIKFEDASDVGVARLTKINDDGSEGEEINLLNNDEFKRSNTYTVNKSGVYELKAEDKNGNAIMPIRFKVTI